MITRFAPSPTGHLHLGHAFSALTAFDLAVAAKGTFLLRIDDIDQGRARPAFEAMIFEDLAWLGLTWPEPVVRQIQTHDRFLWAMGRLEALDLLYPCRCSRRDVEAAVGAPQEGVPTHGPDGRIYPGTCRGRSMADAGPEDAIRLDIRRAIEAAAPLPGFDDTGSEHPGHHSLDSVDFPQFVGDVVVARKGLAASYHLSVVVDDADQGVTLVARGADLFETTPIHVLLGHLLGLPIPTYHHHRLIRDETGKRLAKRDQSRALRTLREDGASPADIRRMLGL